ncbi:hypothetical protein [Pedobacter hiemivivus]|uniref:DUF2157 domain-containing protein n=1 Tax=Pedobacter hiemivivus TaxID=2530454 RepID=A0A4V2MJP3_9SPHI|nr:hypothetical protein [Pedobacter hiemivivus]TCC95056.1 hypothetical protein EZ444_16265 [Pedobacter hiemivivus]
MIIYNKEWLNSLSIQDEAAIAFAQGNIDTEEHNNIKEKYPVGFYSPNIFMRAGIFLLTLIILSFSIGLLSLVLSDFKIIDSFYYLLFLGVVTYVALEFMVIEKRHYQSGADDALMWVSGGLLLFSFIFMMDNIFLSKNSGQAELFISGFIFLLSAYFMARFADTLIAITCILSLAAFVFYGWLEIGFYALQTLPFLMMILSGAIYYVANLLQQRQQYPFYKNCISAVKMISLLLLYLSGNYFVVRELGSNLSDDALKEGQSIPFAWFFWSWTFIIPLLYIGFGLKKKDTVLLRGGFILVAIAAFTFRNYYHILPTELVLVLAGIALIGIAWFTMKYLKSPRNGFTAAEIADGHILDKIQVESLIVGETLSSQPVGADAHRMGGGNFGGGGSSGSF